MEATVISDAKEVVLSLIDALNREDFNEARQYAAENMKFVGVMGSRDSAEAYFTDMEKMKLKYKVQKAFVEENDVCLWYDLTMSGKNILGCALYKVKEGKVTSLKVLFDPRPFLDKK